MKGCPSSLVHIRSMQLSEVLAYSDDEARRPGEMRRPPRFLGVRKAGSHPDGRDGSRRCERCLSVGHVPGAVTDREPEPPDLATEIRADRGAYRTRNPPYPVRIRQTPIAKPRGIAGISRPGFGCLGEVCAFTDSVAVEGVQGELVSGVRSLFTRENTGNFFERAGRS